MAEYMAGKGTTALGIIGTALGGLATAAGTNLVGNMGRENGQYVTKEVFDMSLALNKAETQNALLEAKLENERLVGKVKDAQADWNAAQAVTNSIVTSNMAVMQSNINQLMGLTQLIVPNRSVEPGWGRVQVVPTPPFPTTPEVAPTSSTSTTNG